MALVVLLRGVNVGGHRSFRPTELARQLADFDVVNVGAAGTFVIRRPVAQVRMRAEIARRLPFATEIVICRDRDVLGLLARNPFARWPERPGITRFVSVLARRPRSSPAMPLTLPASREWLLRVLGRDGRFVVGLYRRRMKAIGLLGEIDRLYGVPATTRSWSTMLRVERALRG